MLQASTTSQLRILVIEDDESMCEATVTALTNIGYVACGIHSGEELDDALAHFHADILLLDISLPGEDGLSIAKRMRQTSNVIGIIMLTGCTRLEDKVVAYDNGADLYLTKPTPIKELSAAINSVVRRVRQVEVNTLQKLTLNLDTLELKGQSGNVGISKRECSLLTAFVKAEECLLDNSRLIAATGKPIEGMSKSTLEVQIVRLRKKLEEAGAQAPTIKAIRGLGYQLCTPIVLHRTPQG